MSEERIEILTHTGAPTGTSKAKSAIHRDGEWHRSVHVWLVTRDRKLVLQRRSSRKVNHPGLWDISAAGHVSAGETALEAAVRETSEELGVELSPPDLLHIAESREEWLLHDGGYVDRELQSVFLAMLPGEQSELCFQRDEVDETCLVSTEELRRRVDAHDASLVGHWVEYELVLALLH